MQKKFRFHNENGYSLIEMVMGLGILAVVAVIGPKLLSQWQKQYAGLTLSATVNKDSDNFLSVLSFINTRKSQGSFEDLPQTYELSGTFYVATEGASYPVEFQTKCRNIPSYYNKDDVAKVINALEKRTKDRLGKCYLRQQCPSDQAPFVEISVADPDAPKLNRSFPQLTKSQKGAVMLSAVGCLRYYPGKMVHVIMEGMMQRPMKKKSTSVRVWSREIYLPDDALYSFQRY